MKSMNDRNGAAAGAKGRMIRTGMTLARVGALALAALASQGGWAAGTAGDLLGECLKPTQIEDSETFARTGKATGLCRGYLGRIFGMLSAGGGGGMAARHGICLPAEVPADDDLVSIFVDYAQGNPGRLEERQLPVALAAFHGAWPCPAAAQPEAARAETPEGVTERTAVSTASPRPPPVAASPPAPDWPVSDIQRRLKSLGYDPGPVDGVIGPLTTSAIRAFQRDHSFTPDGRFSEALLRAIQRVGGDQ